MSAPAPLRRLWGTISEPRTVSLMCGIAYAGSGGAGLLLLLGDRDPGPVHGLDLVIAAVCLTVGGAIASLAAWRGWHGVERPSGGIVVTGVAVLVVAEILRWHITGIGGSSSAVPAILRTVLAIGIIARLEAIRGREYAADRASEVTLAQARACLAVQRRLEADAVADAVVEADAARHGGRADGGEA